MVNILATSPCRDPHTTSTGSQSEISTRQTTQPGIRMCRESLAGNTGEERSVGQTNAYRPWTDPGHRDHNTIRAIRAGKGRLDKMAIHGATPQSTPEGRRSDLERLQNLWQGRLGSCVFLFGKRRNCGPNSQTPSLADSQSTRPINSSDDF